MEEAQEVNGPEHFREAERLLQQASGSPDSTHQRYVERAQVHATLALVAATVDASKQATAAWIRQADLG